MGTKRKFSGHNAQITENQSGGCPPATAYSELIEVPFFIKGTSIYLYL